MKPCAPRARVRACRALRLPLTAAAVALSVIPACTGDASLGTQVLVLGPDARVSSSDAGSPRAPAPDAGAFAAVDAGAGSGPIELAFRVAGAEVSELRVACPDSCVGVEIVARGGSPPYQLAWGDGNTQPQRTVCPQADQVLVASARDARGAEQSAMLAVRRIACRTGQLCAKNLSFEGAPTLGSAWLSEGALDAAPWSDCRASNPDFRSVAPRVVTAASGDEFPDASADATYLYLESNRGAQGYVSQTLCSPVQRGAAYHFQLDLAYAAENHLGAPIDPGELEIYASHEACTRQQLVWRSPQLTTAWQTFCATLTPTEDFGTLVLSPVSGSDQHAIVFVDHIVAVDACP